MKCSALRFLLLSVGALAWSAGASAAATAEQVASLGKDRTCMGAERAGNADGSIPEFTGKWFKTWPGQTQEHGYEPGPYADEEPLFTITAENADEYAEQLTAGQKALLAKYPDDFRMKVYPTHRDFRFADWVCDIIKKNATEATIVDDGLGITGTTGAPPFPFPNSGLEAIWNVINPHRASTEQAVTDIANVYSNGSIAWGRNKFMTLNPGNDPDPDKRASFADHINAYFYTGYILPRRDRGFVAVGYQPNNFSKDATQSWQYVPGTRRVRQAPEVGFDTPVPPAGMRVVDDDYLFNGSPERYTWKLVGKKEFYVPFHNNRVNDPAIPYSDLLGPHSLNPDYVRYEKRRVWVIEGELKDGVRHIYKKRTVYADEDTWLALWADSYDNRDELWRTNFVAYFYSQESGTYHRGASIYHDLNAGAYEAGYLTNERGNDWWRLNVPLTPDHFSAQAAARGGH
ncbi:DUF1329 domain-containing protein [Polycyclovorans algicola]|uniref:DUF1329 domain-containing protein n=1 Tax=Polycyclovorans algicola TaxID=616992 RepID=UPI0005B9634F|nr:DUF1329 domain-containing protein [Polycyclovorans algicola]